MRKILIYTDGSCLGNPGFGGYGAIILDGEKEIILKDGEEKTTNNRMELRGIIEALRWTSGNCTATQVHIFSDSSLMIQSITKGWKRKKNLDLWKEFDELNEKVWSKKNTVTWNWVKGHSTDKYNQRVDKIAVAEAVQQRNSAKSRRLNCAPEGTMNKIKVLE